MRPRRAGRRALILAETMAAGTLLVAGMVMTLQLLRWTADERRGAERRGWALQEAANAMERISSLRFDSLDTESARSAGTLSPSARSVLPGGEIRVDVRNASAGPGAAMKRILLEVHYRGTSGREETPVRLSAWVARNGGGR